MLTTEEKIKIEAELYIKVSSSYKKRKEQAAGLIKEFLSKTKKPYVACSWGKDSIVALHLALLQKPDILVMWKNMGEIVPPETLTCRDQWLKLFTLNYKEILAPVKFESIEYGDIENSEKQFIDSVKKGARERDKWLYYEYDTDGVILGLRKEESLGRKAMLNQYGGIYWRDFNKMWHCNPLKEWKVKDVYAYITQFSLPYSDLYKNETFASKDKIRTCVTANPAFLSEGQLVELKYRDIGKFNELRKKNPDINNFT